MAEYIANQKVLFKTTLFGKNYVWLQDPSGKIYLVKVDKHGVPDFS